MVQKGHKVDKKQIIIKWALWSNDYEEMIALYDEQIHIQNTQWVF